MKDVKEYNGVLGKFSYDENIWIVNEDNPREPYLEFNDSYFGPITIPAGVTSLAKTFKDKDIKPGTSLKRSDTSKVESVASMFENARIPDKFVSISGRLDTSNVSDFTRMFANAKLQSLTILDGNNFVINRNAKTTEMMDNVTFDGIRLTTEECRDIVYSLQRRAIQRDSIALTNTDASLFRIESMESSIRVRSKVAVTREEPTRDLLTLLTLCSEEVSNEVMDQLLVVAKDFPFGQTENELLAILEETQDTSLAAEVERAVKEASKWQITEDNFAGTQNHTKVTLTEKELLERAYAAVQFIRANNVEPMLERCVLTLCEQVTEPSEAKRRLCFRICCYLDNHLNDIENTGFRTLVNDLVAMLASTFMTWDFTQVLKISKSSLDKCSNWEEFKRLVEARCLSGDPL